MYCVEPRLNFRKRFPKVSVASVNRGQGSRGGDPDDCPLAGLFYNSGLRPVRTFTTWFRSVAKNPAWLRFDTIAVASTLRHGAGGGGGGGVGGAAAVPIHSLFANLHPYPGLMTTTAARHSGHFKKSVWEKNQNKTEPAYPAIPRCTTYSSR